MPVLRTKVEPGIALRVLLLCCMVGGICGGLVTMVIDARKFIREPAWMELVRACESDKDRCPEAEALLTRQCRGGDHAACVFPSLTRRVP